MPSNTPLSAAEFRRLAHDVCFWHRQGGNDPNLNPGAAISLGAAVRALDAAMEASPVTLEEALCAEQAGCCDLCNNEPANVEIACSQYIDAMLSVEEQGRTINARRLAGEGGAK